MTEHERGIRAGLKYAASWLLQGHEGYTDLDILATSLTEDIDDIVTELANIKCGCICHDKQYGCGSDSNDHSECCES
jgi:N12 class adenine-specific DNA methylase